MINDFKRINEIENINVEIVGKDYIPVHRGNYNILSGAGGVGKSLIALKMLIHFLEEKPNEQAVAIFSEDTRTQIEERVASIVKYMRITSEEVFKRTFFKTLDNDDGRVFAMKDGRNCIEDYEYFSSFVVNARIHKIGFIILDPLERFHTGLSENDEGDMKFLVTSIFQRLAKETGTAIVVLHHTAKGDKSGARGSGVITNKGRVAYNVRRNTVTDKDSGLEVNRDGWETSVLLTTIKDNHYVSRYCNAINLFDGKLELPISIEPRVVEVEYEM